MDRVKEAAALRPDKNIGILLDTKGPEIRTGFFNEKCKGKIHLKAGSSVELTTDYSFKGDETKFACTYDKLPTSVKPGSLILIADGSLVLRVTKVLATSVMCNIENDQSIGERKNMNPPTSRWTCPCSSPRTLTTCRTSASSAASTSSPPPSCRAPPTSPSSARSSARRVRTSRSSPRSRTRRASTSSTRSG